MLVVEFQFRCSSLKLFFYKIKIIIIELAQPIQSELSPSSIIRDGKNCKIVQGESKVREGQRSWR